MTRHSHLPLEPENSATTTTLPANAIPTPSTFNDGLPLPKMMVFDLDYTLWPLWCDTHVSGPIKGSKDNGRTVYDAYGGSYGFYSDVAGILATLKQRNIVIGAASRTSATEVARSMLTHLRVPFTAEDSKETSAKAIGMFDYMEIYPGSKTTHFQRLHKKSGIKYEEMLFFDDESRNKNVEELGVVMHLIRNGVTVAEVDKGVEAWRKRNGRTKKEASG
ncbi:hypothetical protein BAUCODRAFT_403449 [Baudoinia panamericana UAMH 10762]|uniref:Magnesium-dependent phosphatase-1 n=1 Tax=Baudoinia panamericana (strain UAMH 10762) TaxID=717646 RepID=M2NFJ1_BAUPA|nr:uncharacterized protein BAUCODRAFT_403449 [Baudoinia panamericana UAMH 10762]EMC97770.1 hypothetical protein BAUCODRAFT_403449 [Baudoinia panamericana UAMH 10762]